MQFILMLLSNQSNVAAVHDMGIENNQLEVSTAIILILISGVAMQVLYLRK